MLQVINLQVVQHGVAHWKVVARIMDIVVHQVTSNKKRAERFDPRCRNEQTEQQPQAQHNDHRAGRRHYQAGFVVRRVVVHAVK